MEQYYKSTVTGLTKTQFQWIQKLGKQKFNNHKLYGLLVAV